MGYNVLYATCSKVAVIVSGEKTKPQKCHFDLIVSSEFPVLS